MYQLVLHYSHKTLKKVFEDKTSLLQFYKNEVGYFDEMDKLLNANVYPVTRLNQDGSAVIDTDKVEYLPKKVLDKEPQGKDVQRVEWLSQMSNRRLDQMKMLFNLCEHNFDKLLQLEAKLHKLHLYVTPGSVEAVDFVLSSDVNTNEKAVEGLRKFN